jgi:hypothetical protein
MALGRLVDALSFGAGDAVKPSIGPGCTGHPPGLELGLGQPPHAPAGLAVEAQLVGPATTRNPVRTKTIGEDECGNAERRAIFVGLWPPMFWLIGDTMRRHEERRGRLRGAVRALLAD